MPSVITSKPAIHDHFKTGQRSCTQNMKLFYLADARSCKFCSGLLLTCHARSRPTGGRRMLRMKLFVFPSEEGFCFAFERGRRGEAPAGFGAEPRAGQLK